jgi:hypothetical protein
MSDHFIYLSVLALSSSAAVIAQLGERKTEDLKVSGSIPDDGNVFVLHDQNQQAHVMYFQWTKSQLYHQIIRSNQQS